MTPRPRFALLRLVVLVSLALRCGTGDAVGLGPLRLQSALGQPLRATVQVLGNDAGKLVESCIRVSLKMPDGSDIVRPQFELKRGRTTTAELAISTTRTVDEPAVALLVEITCSPTLHRDYQLLLDLRDGLPGVVSTLGEEAQQESPARNAVSNAGEGSSRSRRRSTSNARAASGGLRAVAASELETMSPDDAPKPRAVQIKAAPVALSVLKLTQTNTLQGESMQSPTRQAAGLKFSQSLGLGMGLGADPSRPDSEELNAAKARFQAILRNEDALVTARKELKALQSQAVAGASVAKPAATGSAAVPALPLQATQTPQTAQSTQPPTPPAPPVGRAQDQPVGQRISGSAVRKPAAGESRTVLASTSMMLGLAFLVAAGLAMLWRRLRGGNRTSSAAARKNTPWWLTAGDDTSREAELLESARASVARKEPAMVDAGAAALDAEIVNDKALRRYVNHFVGKRGGVNATVDARIEPLGVVQGSGEWTAGMPSAPGVQPSMKATQSGPVPVQAGHSDDTRSELARSKFATFELVSDVMQEAEFWKMLNETQRAIDILENYCGSAASVSPAPWLYLSDLYRGIGDDERHARLCIRFREIFNGRLHEADANTPAGRETLEGYPHLMEQISALWGQEEVVPFLQGLLVNDRDSPREGFYLPVYLEILLLIDVAMEREQAVA